MNTGERNSAKTMKLKKLRTRADDMSMMEEDYHTGLSASVPFKWESEPGTPKPNFNQNKGGFFSPLTPPPSYFSNDNDNNSPHISSSKPSPKPINFFNSVFRKLSSNPATLHPPSPGSLSSSSSSSSSSSKVYDDDNDDENLESPVSTLFFGRGSHKGCYPKLVKVFTRDSE